MTSATPTHKKIHFIVKGRVQGVGYRNATQKTAEKIGVGGWVRNLSTGDVEVYAEGAEAQVQQLLQWCHRGPLFAKVIEIVIQTNASLAQVATTTFEIRETH